MKHYRKLYLYRLCINFVVNIFWKHLNRLQRITNAGFYISDLGNYDTAGLATYYNTADTLTRPQATPPPPPNIVSQAEARESIIATRPISLPTPTVITGRSGGGMGGFGLSGLSGTCVDMTDYDEARKDDGSGGGDIEKYAQDNLNLNCGRPKGLRLLFRKKFSVRDILSWSKDPIPQPMLVVVDGEKLLKREACNLFRLVQVCAAKFHWH